MARNLLVALFRGVKANLPILATGEMGFTSDTTQLFIGNNSANKLLAPLPVYNTAGVLQNPVHVVMGSVTMGSGGTATITLAGAAVFSSATSYSVYVTDNVVKRTLNVVQTSGTSFSIAGGGTGDVVQFLCIGS
jgi:hypothetical protein